MAQTSTMLELGTPLPDATLTDVRTGGKVTLSELEGDAFVVMFICNHCPYVKHIQSGLVALGEDYADQPVSIVAVSSNDPETYPDDAPDALARVADELGYRFPVLFDEGQDVAKAFTAACTPDFFVFGPGRTLDYRGQFDDSRPGNDLEVTGVDLRAAIDAVSAQKEVPIEQRPSVGCGIKWRPGNEPAR